MCGISGIVNLRDEPVDCGELHAMIRAISHRGPDDEGFALVNSRSGASNYFSGSESSPEIKEQYPYLNNRAALGNIGLAHRRFSIIDLSAAGHQPFVSSDGSCCVVFNGEIYNYLELRGELTRAGVAFRSRSDTEVLIESYKAWGTKCFERFNGFWALALYDFRDRRLILSRDRIGKKPLFWARDGETIYFASEIKALLAVKRIASQKRVNEEAAFLWLAYGRKNLNNQTSFDGIRSIPAGTWTAIDAHFPDQCIRYWDLPRQRLSENDVSANEAAARIRKLLEDSVRIRMHADVPVAVELSGGLDSSTLVALAASISPTQVKTFTVRFPEKEWNEEPFARDVAERFNVEYNILESPIGRFWNQIQAFTWLEEEPYHAPNLQTNQEVWTEMRAKGVKVSLNGAAGDEIFAGYGHYFFLAQAELLAQGRVTSLVKNVAFCSEAKNGLTASARLALWAASNLRRRCNVPELFHSGSQFEFANRHEDPAKHNILSDSLYSDMTNTLMPYWLTSGDRGYMGIPLEVRAPFLDCNVVDFAFRLPIGYLVRGGWQKWILRKAMQDVLPSGVVWRRKKLGFPFAFDRFYNENQEILNLIFEKADNPYVNMRYRTKFARDWKVISFLLWYEMFFNSNLKLFREIESMADRRSMAEPRNHEPEFIRRSISFPILELENG